MLIDYLKRKGFNAEVITVENRNLLQDAIWIDLISPSKEEESIVENELDFNVPTREEMQEIELSSRLYKEDNTVFMTVNMVARSAALDPIVDAVTLIIKDDKLITVRYVEPQSFAFFMNRLIKLPPENCNALYLLIELLDASVDRLADIIERVAYSLEHYSQAIFRPHNHHKTNVTASKSNKFNKINSSSVLHGSNTSSSAHISNMSSRASVDKESSNKKNSHKLAYTRVDHKLRLQELGANVDLNTKIQDSLVTFNRLITFFCQIFEEKLDKDMQTKLHTISQDIHFLSDYLTFLSNKAYFLLDATLGMINIEQNDIIKIFSIVAVILLPPTLVASIYGMNFQHMPELSWRIGYPFAIVLMLISAWLPYKYFKKKKWL